MRRRTFGGNDRRSPDHEPVPRLHRHRLVQSNRRATGAPGSRNQVTASLSSIPLNRPSGEAPTELARRLRLQDLRSASPAARSPSAARSPPSAGSGAAAGSSRSSNTATCPAPPTAPPRPRRRPPSMAPGTGPVRRCCTGSGTIHHRRRPCADAEPAPPCPTTPHPPPRTGPAQHTQHRSTSSGRIQTRPRVVDRRRHHQPLHVHRRRAPTSPSATTDDPPATPDPPQRRQRSSSERTASVPPRTARPSSFAVSSDALDNRPRDRAHDPRRRIRMPEPILADPIGRGRRSRHRPAAVRVVQHLDGALERVRLV
jgi:hypothetical protein